jgi:AcrR family transcriptional regulator
MPAHVYSSNIDRGSVHGQHAVMTQLRDAYHHGDLRNALVASAVRLIETGGSGGFSLREAAREVGVSANAAYRHFDTKSALITAVAADGFARLAERIRRAMASASTGQGDEPASIARFKAACCAYVAFAADHREIYRVMFGECGVACVGATPGHDEAETPWTLLGRALDALVAEGFLSPERRQGAELTVWTVVHGFASLSLDNLAAATTPQERMASLASLLDFTVRGLCARTPVWGSAR